MHDFLQKSLSCIGHNSQRPFGDFLIRCFTSIFSLHGTKIESEHVRYVMELFRSVWDPLINFFRSSSLDTPGFLVVLESFSKSIALFFRGIRSNSTVLDPSSSVADSSSSSLGLFHPEEIRCAGLLRSLWVYTFFTIQPFFTDQSLSSLPGAILTLCVSGEEISVRTRGLLSFSFFCK